MKKIIMTVILVFALSCSAFSAIIDMESVSKTGSFGGYTMLDGVTYTTTAYSNTLAFPFPMSAFTINIVLAGGTVSAMSTTLEGSLDGSNWFTLSTYTNTSGESAHVVNKPVMFIRVGHSKTVATSTPAVTVKVSGAKGL